MDFLARELGGEGEFHPDGCVLPLILPLIPRINLYYHPFLLGKRLTKAGHDYFPARESAIMM